MSRRLLICHLAKELKFVLEYFSHKNILIQETNLSKYPIYFLPDKNLYCAVGGHGKTQFGIQTQFLVSQLSEVSSVFCLGAGGGLSNKVSIFDVVVGVQTLEHDYKERFDTHATIPVFDAAPDLVSKLRLIKQLNFQVHFGSIASGDEDIVNSDRAYELYSETKALVVAWEGVGGARACKFNKIPYVEIRAITDNARTNVASNFSKNLNNAIKNAVQLIDEALLTL